jgi:hypothetical protein
VRQWQEVEAMLRQRRARALEFAEARMLVGHAQWRGERRNLSHKPTFWNIHFSDN